MATAHDFTFPRLNGGAPIAMNAYAGKAVLLVNVASACGFTPQYAALQQLSTLPSMKNLVVLGAPSNDFGAQEQGSESAIAAFCESKYQVTFPMTGKVSILGADRHPFYEWVRAELGDDALPKWNFHKYLIGKDGLLRESFPSSSAPLGPELAFKLADALAA